MNAATVGLPRLWQEQQRLLNAGNARRSMKFLLKTVGRFPNDYVSLTNIAALCYNGGKDEQALHWIRKAVATPKGARSPHTRLISAQIELKCGNWRQGWLDYEWRFATAAVPKQAPYETLWDGEQLEPGQTLHIWSEQGLGDQIQMARFVPEAKRRAGVKTVLVCDKSLVRLFEGLADEVVEKQTMGEGDRHAPLFSLPRILGVTVENLNGKPYLKGSPKWHQGWRIGFCFRSTSSDREMQDRYVPEGLQERLLGSEEDVEWISLQVGKSGFEPSDFLDTARRTDECDLVITIDTSVAHLCGALGVPTWLLLRHQGDFRWLRDRTDTPWYDGMYLYRQPKMGDWHSVIQTVEQELKGLVYASRVGDCA